MVVVDVVVVVVEQGPELQCPSLSIFPEQFAPPLLGGGLEHSLRLLRTPGPQTEVHSLQELQRDHFPFTGPIFGWVFRLI